MSPRYDMHMQALTSIYHLVFCRPVTMACLLRPGKRDKQENGPRTRILGWAREASRLLEAWGHTTVIGHVTDSSRRAFDMRYLEVLRNTKVVVTVNPSRWDGDYRLWEAMASGATVLVDRLHVPLREPLVDGQHIIHYDNTNRSDFLSKLWEAVGSRRGGKAARIASKGRDHVLMHHRIVARVDFVLTTLTQPPSAGVDLRARCAGGAWH